MKLTLLAITLKNIAGRAMHRDHNMLLLILRCVIHPSCSQKQVKIKSIFIYEDLLTRKPLTIYQFKEYDKAK